MKGICLGLVVVGGLLACRSGEETMAKTAAPATAAWSYEGSTGPEKWGDLSPDYALARTGKHQSPIDIDTSKTKPMDASPLETNYHDTTLEILNNGHTIEDDYHDGGTLTVDGRQYVLAQFHFHSPSEHTIDGKHAPMEMHLVHKDASGKLAVIGVMIHEGRPHPELAILWQHMPIAVGRSKPVQGVQVNASRLLPKSLASYRYSGSLTTPPCSEGVSWFILKEPVEASADQIATFRKVIHANNRPTQSVNDRTITASK